MTLPTGVLWDYRNQSTEIWHCTQFAVNSGKQSISRYLFFRMHFNQVKIDQNDPSQNTTNSWIIGKNYEPDQKKLLPCIIYAKTVRDKFQKCDSGPCYIVDDDENFLIVSPEVVKTAWAHVQYNSKLMNVEAVVDRAEPRVLIEQKQSKRINLTRFQMKDQFVDLQLYFDDHTLCQEAKKNIDEKRREYKANQLKIIEHQLSVLLKLCEQKQ